jgi:hypothetical protein
MPVATSADFLDAVRQTHVLDTKQLDEATGLSGQFADLKAFASELVPRGWLTTWQCNQIGKGRGRELVLEPYVLLALLGEGGMGQVYKARVKKGVGSLLYGHAAAAALASRQAAQVRTRAYASATWPVKADRRLCLIISAESHGSAGSRTAHAVWLATEGKHRLWSLLCS